MPQKSSFACHVSLGLLVATLRSSGGLATQCAACPGQGSLTNRHGLPGGGGALDNGQLIGHCEGGRFCSIWLPLQWHELLYGLT
jgi:hypothetical protein